MMTRTKPLNLEDAPTKTLGVSLVKYINIIGLQFVDKY